MNRNACTLSVISQAATISIASFGDDQIQSVIDVLALPLTTSSTKVSTKRQRSNNVDNSDRKLLDGKFRRSILDATNESDIPFLKSLLLQYWPFRVKGEHFQATAGNYARLFAVAAVIRSLLTTQLTTPLQIVNWINNSFPKVSVYIVPSNGSNSE